MIKVTTRIPGTTSNLGPGFDCLGIALSLWNRVTISLSQAEEEHPRIVKDAAKLFFLKTGSVPINFTWSIEGDVPRSRGLGSSVTVRLGVLNGLNELLRTGLTRAELFELCAQLEGHPDNAAPAVFGGFAVSRMGAETICCEVAPELKFVLLIPGFELPTDEARRVLPDSLPRTDAVMSSTNACRLTAAFLQQRYDLLPGNFADGLHQSYRTPMIPFLGNAIAAAERAGALGGFLSGSGSTICAVAMNCADDIAAAMLDTAPPGSCAMVTMADNAGATLES